MNSGTCRVICSNCGEDAHPCRCIRTRDAETIKRLCELIDAIEQWRYPIELSGTYEDHTREGWAYECKLCHEKTRLKDCRDAKRISDVPHGPDCPVLVYLKVREGL